MKILKKINDWLFAFKQHHQRVHTVLDDVYRPVDSIQLNQRDIEVKKRVGKAIESQSQELQARALKPHDSSCEDPLVCAKKICFRPVPDKIVSKSEVSVQEVRDEMYKRSRSKKRTSVIDHSK